MLVDQALTSDISLRKSGLSATRSALFIAILLLGWISVSPFEDLADLRVIEVRETSVVLNQIAYLALGASAAYFCYRLPLALRALMRPVYIAAIAWFIVSVVTSDHPDVSAKRAILGALVILLAAVMPLLPSYRSYFVDHIAAASAAVLFLCFAGVLLVPHLSVHQAFDVVDQGLEGNWRGLFPHKNITGPMMAFFVFVGLFVAQTRNAIFGWSIAIAAVVFLIFTAAKTATALLPLILFCSWACVRLRSLAIRTAMLLTVFVALNFFTVGSLYSQVAKSANEYWLPDPTFTGRTEIWQFAIDGIAQRPIFGYGFGSFWQTEESAGGNSLEWNGPESAANAHNSFLDLALTTGIPGAILGLFWMVVLPMKDLHRAIEARADPNLTQLFMRIWLFGLYCTPFEEIIFAGSNPVWFTMLMSMFGLYYLATARSVRYGEP